MNPYNREWYDSLRQYNPFLETAYYAVCAHFGLPQSLLDLGCGTGYILAIAKRMLVYPVIGVEVSEEAQYGIAHIPLHIHDLRQSLDLGYRFEMTFCWEVGEHLESEHADVFCSNIARHVGRWLVFTAAHPGQGGRYHLNEQPQEYWRAKLQARGLKYSPERTQQLKATWTWTTGPCWWLPANLQVFENGNHA